MQKFEIVHGPLQRPLSGLAWDGARILVSDTTGNAILAFDPSTKGISTWRRFTNRTNGIAFGVDGELFGCQEGSRRVVRFLQNGAATPTATRFEGQPHNHPNLIAVDSLGAAWFTDCHHHTPASGPQVFPALEHQSVLRLKIGGRPHSHWHLERMTFDTISPRGVALAPDGKVLYVSDTSNAPGGVRELRSYPILDDDTLGPHSVMHTFGADWRGVHRGAEGICVDDDGHVHACAGWMRSGPGPVIMKFSSSGVVLSSFELPVDLPLNCAFGDPDLGTLYVTTANGELLRTRIPGVRGLRQHLPAQGGGIAPAHSPMSTTR